MSDSALEKTIIEKFRTFLIENDLVPKYRSKEYPFDIVRDTVKFSIQKGTTTEEAIENFEEIYKKAMIGAIEYIKMREQIHLEWMDEILLMLKGQL
jgi:hypothetical protein